MSQVLEPQVISSPSLQPTPQTLVNLSDELTNKQKLFVYYYLEHKNGTRAARLAGYEGNDSVKL